MPRPRRCTRSSDACNARWEHVDWRTEENWIKNEKIQTPRRIHMPPPFFDAVKRWHEACGSPKGGYLFESSNGGRNAKRGTTFAKALRKALALAGYGPATHPELHQEMDFTLPVDDHSIRRLAITAMAEAGVNHQTAMNLVGHRSAATHALPPDDEEDDGATRGGGGRVLGGAGRRRNRL